VRQSLGRILRLGQQVRHCPLRVDRQGL